MIVIGSSAAATERHQIKVYALGALLAVAVALVAPGAAASLQVLINPVLAVLLYATFLEVPFIAVRRAFARPRFLLAALGMNFLVVPMVVFALTRFVPHEPAILVGVLMVLLTPCIDYVVAFTRQAGGDAARLTAATPVLMIVQLLLLPVYLWLFIGRDVAAAVEPGPFIKAFLSIIALPLALAWATEAWSVRREAGRRWQRGVGRLPVPMLALTLFVVITSQLPRVQRPLSKIAWVVPLYAAFLVVVPLVAGVVAILSGMGPGEARALVFTSVTRNSLVVLPLALALPAGDGLAAAVVVTQTLVELAGMVLLVQIVSRWSPAGRPSTST